MKIKLKYALLFLAIIISAIIFYSLLPERTEEADNPAGIGYGNLEEVVFEVKTSQVVSGDLIKSVSANGIAKAYTELDIIANASGFIDQVNIFEGKSISNGSLLLKLDDREYKIALEEAQSKLSEAKIQFVIQKKEIGELNHSDDGSRIKKELLKLEEDKTTLKSDEYDKRRNELESELILSGAEREKVIENRSGLTSARINYEKASLMLSYTRIIAPFSGLISDFDLVEGTRITSGEKLFRLVDVSKIKIDVGVLENDVSAIQVGSRARITFNAFPGEEFDGEIIYINPCIDPVTKTCRVTIEAQNKINKIKPGMFASVMLSSQVLKNRILIPRSALVIRDRRNLVFVQEADLAKWKYVDIGEQNEKYIEIVNGIKAGEKVIVEGNFNLAHDARIKVK